MGYKEELEKELENEDRALEDDDQYISLVNVNKVYDGDVHAVIDFNLDIAKREFIVFVGPSGCGKSTTLRMIAGFEDISAGEFYIDGVLANNLTAKERDIAMVFQSYALYPNMTVYDNIAFSLKVRHFPKDVIDERVHEAAEILEIEEYLNRRPKALSGGQRQRVALGRAIVRKPKLFLMDEPLSNLDAKLRVQMRSEIIRLHERIHATTIYVTHDQTEAMTMADRIVVMKKGVVQQIGTPFEVYRHPANLFVASFIGSPAMNFLECKYSKGHLILKSGERIKLNSEVIKAHDDFYKKRLENGIKKLNALPDILQEEYDEARKNPKKRRKLPKSFDPYDSDEYLDQVDYVEELKRIVNEGAEHSIIFGIRPEAIKQVDKKGPDTIVTNISLSELLGDEYYVHFNYGGKDILAKVATDAIIKTGDKIMLEIQQSHIHLFDTRFEKAII